MKLRIFLTALAACLLLSACAAGETAETKQPMVSSALEAVQAVASEEIESITYTRYTEGGAFSGSVTDPGTVKEICRRCGIESEFYFSRLFKNTFRVAPGEYRREFPSDSSVSCK